MDVETLRLGNMLKFNSSDGRRQRMNDIVVKLKGLEIDRRIK